MSLQRSLQNGRHGDLSDHSTGRRHVGQETVGMLEANRRDQVQVVSKNFTSSVVCTGRAFTSSQLMKRMLQR